MHANAEEETAWLIRTELQPILVDVKHSGHTSMIEIRTREGAGTATTVLAGSHAPHTNIDFEEFLLEAKQLMKHKEKHISCWIGDFNVDMSKRISAEGEQEMTAERITGKSGTGSTSTCPASE